MAVAFYWECEDFRLAVAPWRSDPQRQQVAKTRVSVAEQRTPGFALRFDLELLENGEEKADPVRLMRLVNQRQMLRAFEFAFVGDEAAKRRPPGGEPDELLDQRVKKWLAGGGQVPPPPKEELAQWLLAWMIVAPAADSGGDKQPVDRIVLMCGETGAECCVEEDWGEAQDYGEPASADDIRNGENDDHHDDDSAEETEDDDDLPPPYQSAESTPSIPGSASEDEHGSDILENERQQVQSSDIVQPSTLEPATNSKDHASRKVLPVTKRELLRRKSSLASTLASSNSTQSEKPLLKATIVQLNPRLDSLDAILQPEEPSSEWNEERRYFQRELRASRRDVQTTRLRRDKVEQLAQLRHTQLLKNSAKKLRLNEQKRRDAQAVRQLIADTLEYRDELCVMESQVKQASISAHRNQERVKRQTRVVLGNTEKALRGAVKIGPGPLSSKEIQILNGKNRDEIAVYDLHGRRHNLEKAGEVWTQSALESASRKVYRLLLHSKDGVALFRRYDIDRSGTLSHNEFQRMLRENGVGELTEEQSAAFFRRFDTDKSGDVDYVELLWGFFDWEAFLKRWSERKSAKATPQSEVKEFFEKHDHAQRGMLALKEFQLVMDYLGVTLSDVDANLLAVKFGTENGYIDYYNFLNCVNASEAVATTFARVQSSAQSALHSDNAPPGMERVWKELKMLTATQARLHHLLQK
ncbi:unnamed protein product [Phytophthora lilii]|uniref:Unnamed protein product n=1 Tax=Phytophthora lilii TaxID=2077276 RepID=A0A9W7D8X4_9STRA|nr:unnamed protein product [Phytophthora lilii]